MGCPRIFARASMKQPPFSQEAGCKRRAVECGGVNRQWRSVKAFTESSVGGCCPHPALRATFSQREKGLRRVALSLWASLWERVALSDSERSEEESKGRVRALSP